MDKTSSPQTQDTGHGANQAARAAAALSTKSAKRARSEQDSMRPETSTLIMNSMRRHEMIAEVAYLKALDRGFSPGCEMQDWLQAEQEIDMQLM